MDEIFIIPKPSWLAWKTIAEFVQTVFEEEVEKGLTYTLSTQSVDEYVMRIKDCFCFIALKNDILIGVALWEIREKNLYFTALAIKKNYRGKGIARELFNAGISLGHEKKVEALTLFTSAESSTVKFFQFLGWQKIGLESFPATNFYSIYFYYPLPGQRCSILKNKIHFHLSVIKCKVLKNKEGKVRMCFYPLYVFVQTIYRKVKRKGSSI